MIPHFSPVVKPLFSLFFAGQNGGAGPSFRKPAPVFPAFPAPEGAGDAKFLLHAVFILLDHLLERVTRMTFIAGTSRFTEVFIKF